MPEWAPVAGGGGPGVGAAPGGGSGKMVRAVQKETPAERMRG